MKLLAMHAVPAVFGIAAATGIDGRTSVTLGLLYKVCLL